MITKLSQTLASCFVFFTLTMPNQSFAEVYSDSRSGYLNGNPQNQSISVRCKYGYKAVHGSCYAPRADIVSSSIYQTGDQTGFTCDLKVRYPLLPRSPKRVTVSCEKIEEPEALAPPVDQQPIKVDPCPHTKTILEGALKNYDMEILEVRIDQKSSKKFFGIEVWNLKRNFATPLFFHDEGKRLYVQLFGPTYGGYETTDDFYVVYDDQSEMKNIKEIRSDENGSKITGDEISVHYPGLVDKMKRFRLFIMTYRAARISCQDDERFFEILESVSEFDIKLGMGKEFVEPN